MEKHPLSHPFMSSRNSDVGFTPCHQKIVPRTCAGNIQKVPFGIVDLIQICLVSNRLYSGLEWDDLSVASHNNNSPEL